MSNILRDYFLNAQLSMAAYAVNLNSDMTPGEYKLALTDVSIGFSNAQADAFIARYAVVDQFTDPDTGFSATVFLDTETNEYHLAMRGTEGAPFNIDVLADLSIGLNGVATNQVLSMLNYYLRLTAPAGEVTQYELVEVTSLLPPEEPHIFLGPAGTFSNNYLVLQEAQAVQSLNIEGLSTATPLTLSGHSLGGHLVDAFVRLFPNLNDSAFTYNGLGVGTGLDQLLGLLDNIIDPFDINPGNTADNIVSNLVAEAGAEFAATIGDNVGGADQFLFIEGVSFLDVGPIDASVHNHSIVNLTDALAVYNLLATVDSNISISSATGILEAASNIAEESLEETVNVIGDLLSAGVKVNIGNRDELYTRIQAIEDDLTNSPFTLTINSLVVMNGEDLTPIDTATLISNAQNNIAYRYALQELNPFVIEGITSIETDQLYVPHNNNFVLDLENFSDEYLADRADFLALKIDLGLADRTSKIGADNITYSDSLLDETININKLAGAGQLPHHPRLHRR